VGAYSYGFYLLHAPVIRYIDTALKRFGLTQQDFDVWLVVLAVALSAAITVVVTHIFERPLKRALAQLVGVTARICATPLTRR
jgi:peptidoglycan/LPS O-acetylase OafA/YrhL